MILCPNPHPDYPDNWIVVKQSDHDDQCGYILSHFNFEDYWRPTDPVMLAVALGVHDTGSAYWEDHPILDADGKPWVYWNIPPDEHVKQHYGGVSLGCEVDPYVGLLVSMHVVGIHRDRLGIDSGLSATHLPINHTPVVDAFVEEQAALQVKLRAEVEHRRGAAFPPEHLMNDFKLFELIDSLSIRFTGLGMQDRDFTYAPDRAGNPMTVSIRRAGTWEFHITPFPFAGDRFECPVIGRAVRRQTYLSDNAFRAEWVNSPQVLLPYALVR